MSPELRPIVMRANRLLGASLVEHNLVKIEDLEKANERLLEILAEGNFREAALLGILSSEMKVVKEEDVLSHLVDSEGLGLIDLRQYDFNEELRRSLDVGACWATWTLPFDKEEDFVYIGTAYYLSPSVRAYWEKIYGSSIVWYGTTLDIIRELLERLERDRAST